MQDLTREEAIAFNTEHNNNSSTTTTHHNNNNKIQMCSSIGVVPKYHNQDQHQHQQLANGLLPCIKLETDNGHILEQEKETERWQHSVVNERLRLELNSTKLLLQGSDDPLISHGASNDTHDEDQDYPFKTLLARKTEEQQTVHNGACSTLTKQQLKANLMNGRKIQRQPVEEVILPTSRITTTQHRQSKSKKRTTPTGAIKLRFHHQALPAEYAAHYEATQGRQLSNQVARATPPVAPVKVTPPPAPQNNSHENVRSWLRKIAEIQRNAERQQQAQVQGSSKESKPMRSATVAAAAATTLLEPIGEVASGKRNAIKYADLPYMGEITLDNYKPRRGRKPKKADICHLIYKNYGTIVPPSSTAPATTTTRTQQYPVGETKATPVVSCRTVPVRRLPNVAEEPLNLCLRDQSSDRYSISSGDSDKPSTGTTPTTECNSPFNRSTPVTEDPFTVEEKSRISAKLLLKPMGLYYQQIMETCRLGLPLETIEKDNQLALKIPIPNGFFETMPQSLSTTTAKREPLEQLISADTLTPPAMRKRKRSAIFIPPMPTEHSSSPSTEVSICKFKFTGGAKPTLQEKKMLSVDAEGNYRYYNGTGDRSMRGYEFISRDQQQTQQQTHPDKLYIDIPPPSTDLSLELLHIPSESPTSSLLMSSSLVPVAPQSPSSYSNSHSPTPHSEDYHKRIESTDLLTSPTPVTTKRRSSRRSKQREKLEKTFKEKGFLIQTQQLQSAEGATYCKFRQLKKFTRYLFRNWKDHIPESDLDKHPVKESDTRVIENILAGQIGLGLESLGTNQAT